MNIFKRKRRFPNEDKHRGILHLSETQIVIENTAYSREIEVIEIGEIEYIYLEICNYSSPGLLIYQGRQHYIPVDYVNTEKLCLQLAKRFNFDMALIYDNIHKEENAVHQLFRTTYQQNFELVTGGQNDYIKGFEIIAPTPCFVPWTTTKGELLNNPHTRLENGYLNIVYPVRIGNIILRDFGAYVDNIRPEIALEEYYAKCYATDGSDKSLYLVKEQLERDLADKAEFTFYSDFNLFFYAKIGPITFEATYSIDDNEMRNIAYSFTSFSARLQFDYPAMLIASDYEQNGVLSQLFVWNEALSTPDNYKTNTHIKQTPEFVLAASKGQAVIWKDEANNLLGFADAEHAQWYAISEVDSFTLWNTLPAKGGGFSSLSITFTDGQQKTLFEGAHDTMSKHLDEVKAFLGFDIQFYEDYNC